MIINKQYQLLCCFAHIYPLDVEINGEACMEYPDLSENINYHLLMQALESVDSFDKGQFSFNIYSDKSKKMPIYMVRIYKDRKKYIEHKNRCLQFCILNAVMDFCFLNKNLIP